MPSEPSETASNVYATGQHRDHAFACGRWRIRWASGVQLTPESRPPQSIAALMLGVGRLGILGFGGVGPQAYDFFVERSGWLSAEEFIEDYSIAQALPGANVVNLCAIFGDRWFGPFGAFAAVSAITLPPLVVILIAAAALGQITRAPRVVAVECSVVAASAGLILATALRVMSSIARRRTAAIVLACAVALAVSLHILSMPVATIVGAAAGLGLERFVRARP